MMNANNSKIFTVNDVKNAIEDATTDKLAWNQNFVDLQDNFQELFNSMKLKLLFEKGKNQLHLCKKDKSQFEIFINIKTKSVKIFLNQGGYSNIPLNFPENEDPIKFCFNTLIYTTTYDTFLQVFNEGFHECEKFNFQDVLDSFNKYIFPELLTKLNYLSLSDHPITESLITTANYREFMTKSDKITYKENYDFLDFKKLKTPEYWSEEPFSFFEEGKINKDGSGVFLPINFINAEDIVNTVLNPKLIVNNKTKNYIANRNDTGFDYYLLDFEDYNDKKRLLQLIQQEDIIDLFPYFKSFQEATERFVTLCWMMPHHFSLMNLNADFHNYYTFNEKKFNKGEDLNFVIYILCRQITKRLTGNNNYENRQEFLQNMWNFLTKFLDIKTIAQKIFDKYSWNNLLDEYSACSTAIIDLDKPLTIQDLSIAKLYYNEKIEDLRLVDDWREQNYQIVDMNVIKNQLNQMLDDKDLKNEVLKMIENVYTLTVQDFRENAIVKERCKVNGHRCEFVMKVKSKTYD